MLNIQNNINAILAHNAGIIYPFKKAAKPPYSDEKTRLYDSLMEWLKGCDGQPVAHALKCDAEGYEMALYPSTPLDVLWLVATTKETKNIAICMTFPCTSSKGHYAHDVDGKKVIKADGIIARIKAEKENYIDAMTAKTEKH